MNGGTISCGFGCDIFFLSSPLFSFRSPGGCAGMHHTGLHSVSMWPLGCSGAGSAARWLESVCNPHGNPPLLQPVPSDFTWLQIEQQNPNHFFLCVCARKTLLQSYSKDLIKKKNVFKKSRPVLAREAEPSDQVKYEAI